MKFLKVDTGPLGLAPNQALLVLLKDGRAVVKTNAAWKQEVILKPVDGGQPLVIRGNGEGNQVQGDKVLKAGMYVATMNHDNGGWKASAIRQDSNLRVRADDGGGGDRDYNDLIVEVTLL